MKKMLALLLAAALAAGMLAGCGGGDVRGAKKIVGKSQIFDEGEILRAMDVAIDLFDEGFNGCTLLEIEYDEEVSNRSAKAWAAQYEADEAIVLLSKFTVDETGGDGSLNPNSTYERYQWILTRSGLGGWKLQTWGYG